MKIKSLSFSKDQVKCLLNTVLAPGMTFLSGAIFTLVCFMFFESFFSTNVRILWVQIFSKLTAIPILFFYCSKIFKFNWHNQLKVNIQFVVAFLVVIVVWWFLKLNILYGGFHNLMFSFHWTEENALILLKSVLIAPVLEELLFRKWMFDYMKSNAFSSLFILIFSSLIFYVWHGEFQRWDLIISGLIFGAVYMKGKNIVYPIIIHALGNLLSSLYVVN